MPEAAEPLRIAIIGGGLAGATLAAGLARLAKLTVRIYESAPSFTERGAAVGISVNGQRALQLLGLGDVLAAAGAVANKGNRFIVGAGARAGTLASEFPAPAVPELVVHRAAFLRELVTRIPEDCMATGKKLARIDERDEAVVLRFEDGTEAEADVLVGADGIHGRVRGHILGEGALAPVFSGVWDARALHPRERVAAALGDNVIDVADSRQHDYVGHGVMMLHDLIDDGATVHLALAARADPATWPAGAWKQPLSREEARALLADWPAGDALAELMTDGPEPTKFAEWVHRDAATYASRRTAVTGDAAHAMSPFQASGATTALEDALVLVTVLGAAGGPAEVPAALAAFDAVRRPRTQAVAASSLETGRLMLGGWEDVGIDPEKLKAALHGRWDFVHDIDLVAHCEEAKKDMAARLSSASVSVDSFIRRFQTCPAQPGVTRSRA